MTRGRRWAVASAILGLVLFAAAIWAVWSQRAAGEAALEAARRAPAWLVVAVVVLPLVNWLLTAGVFHVLTGRYADLRPIEMRALIGSAWLLNYIPARAGLVGRVAYHKAVNAMRVRDAMNVIVRSIACTAAALAGLLGVIALTAATRGPAWMMPGLMVAIGAALVGVGAAWRARDHAAHTWRFATAVGLRFLDVTVWGVRYLAVFTLAGIAATPLAIGVVTAASQASMLLPIQVGAREWVVGIALALTDGGLASHESQENPTPASVLSAAAPGLAADLVNRAAETLVAVPVGLWGTWWVVGRLRKAGGGPDGMNGGLRPEGETTDSPGIRT